MQKHEITKELYGKLKSQISIYSGNVDGGLSSLQDLYHRLKNGKKIVCESCGHRLDKGGMHRWDCSIVNEYEEKFNN